MYHTKSKVLWLRKKMSFTFLCGFFYFLTVFLGFYFCLTRHRTHVDKCSCRRYFIKPNNIASKERKKFSYCPNYKHITKNAIICLKCKRNVIRKNSSIPTIRLTENKGDNSHRIIFLLKINSTYKMCHPATQCEQGDIP